MENSNQNTDLETTEVKLSMPSLSQLGKLTGLKKVFKTSAAYRTQEDWQEFKDKPIRAFYLGLKQLPNDDGEAVTCAIFADQEQIFLCAQYVLVEAVRNAPPQTGFEITYKGKRQNKSSKSKYTNLFDIVQLG